MPLFTLLSVQVCPPFFQPLCAERDARERIPQTEKGVLLGLKAVLFDGIPAGIPPATAFDCLYPTIAGKPTQILGLVAKLAGQIRERKIILLLWGCGGRTGLQVHVQTRLHCLADQIHDRAILASVRFVQPMNVPDPPIFEHQCGRVTLTHEHEVEQKASYSPVSVNKGMDRFKAMVRDGSPRDGFVLLPFGAIDPLLPLSHESGDVSCWGWGHIRSP